jgi:hypothetical protein
VTDASAIGHILAIAEDISGDRYRQTIMTQAREAPDSGTSCESAISH